MTVALEFDHILTVDTCRRLMLGHSPWDRLGLSVDDIDRFASLPPGGEVIAARDGDDVVGIAVCGAPMLLGGYLRLLAVEARHRHRGIGRTLLGAFEERVFARWPNAYLCVSDFNLAARDFYRSAGYREVGALPQLLVEGTAEILMRKTIGPRRTFSAADGMAR